MSRPKEPPDKVPSRQNPFFPEWTTFEWEKISEDMMRGPIEKKPSKTENLETVQTIDNRSQEIFNNFVNDSARANKEETPDGGLFDARDMLQGITSPPDHPSQLVDALKVGLADILISDSYRNVYAEESEDDFSKSNDVTYDPEAFYNETFEAAATSSVYNMDSSNSETEEDLTDVSTTESRESVIIENFYEMKTSSNENESTQKVTGGNELSPELLTASEKDTEESAGTSASKSDAHSATDEEPQTSSSSDFEVVEKVSEEFKVAQSTEDSIHREQRQGITHEDELTIDDLDASWKRDITIEDFPVAKKLNDNEKKKEIKVSAVKPTIAAKPKSKKDEDYFMKTSSPPQFVPPTDIKRNEPPSQNINFSPETLKRSYADALKKGLKPGAVSYVKPLTFAFCFQQDKLKAYKEAKSKSPTNKKSPSTPKEKRAKRPGSSTKRDTSTSSPRSSARKKSPGRVTSSVTPRTKGSPVKNTRRESPSRNPRRKISFDECDYWTKNSPSESSSSVSEETSSEEILRGNMKSQKIAQLLQSAKLALAKLTTESLGSYEKVSCLKQLPSANNDTFKMLQTQEISKSKHMKELANHLHELTKMGLGNAKEFSEIKDILISLHYLQTRDKYFVEKLRKNAKEKKIEKKTDGEISFQFFMGLFFIFVLFLIFFKRHWFLIICLTSLLVAFIFGQNKVSLPAQQMNNQLPAIQNID